MISLRRTQHLCTGSTALQSTPIKPRQTNFEIFYEDPIAQKAEANRISE
jgi:hypothetical protein